jgi:ParB family chromosome partitioning protein
MAGPARGLGRGFEALLGGLPEETPGAEVRTIALDAVRANPQQPRRTFSDEALNDLAQSIKTQGVLQPILVRPTDDPAVFELVAGERRLRASKLAGLTDIPALVKEMSENESLAIALIENLQREDLNAIEEAIGLKELQDRLSLSQDALAKHVGKSRSAVANVMRLLQLPEPIRQLVSSGAVSSGHARALLGMDDPDLQQALAAAIADAGLSVRQVEAAVTHWKQTGELPEDLTAMHKSARSGARKPRECDTELVGLETTLYEQYMVKVTCQGSRNKGRIVFHYSSPEQLDELKSRLKAATTTPDAEAGQ